MHWKFWERPEEYLEETAKPPRAKAQTLKQTAERIVQRKMKKDPEGYGLVASEKLLSMTKEETKSLASQLKEHRELQKTLQDLSGGGGQGWLKELGSGVAQALAPYLGEIVQNLATKQARGQPLIENREQPRLPKAESRPEVETAPEVEKAPETEPEPQFSLEHINDVLALSPKQAVVRLEQYNAEWLTLIAEYNYENFLEAVKLWEKTPLTEPLIKELLSKGRKEWIESVIEEARNTLDAQ